MRPLLLPLALCCCFHFAVAQESSPIAQSLREAPPETSTTAESEQPWYVSATVRDAWPFQVLVWQHHTDALKDKRLYDSVNLKGWHIDRGEGQQDRADWGVLQNRPFYIDHAAGKGILHLTSQSGLNEIPKDGSPAPRPHSFLSDQTWQTLTDRINRHVPDAVNQHTIAIALDDEVSLGTFNSPLEVGFSDASIGLFRAWLKKRHESETDLQVAWGNSKTTFHTAVPATYEEVRRQITQLPPSKWKLAPWMNFRAFMDRQQATMFASLSNYGNRLTCSIPVGIVGAQQPSVYGGFDYSILRHSVQWMEAYDIGGTNELLHSFWSESPRRPRMQTFFASGRLSEDKWFLWYYLAHGCSGVIAWPELQGKPWFENDQVHKAVQALAPTFEEIQSEPLSILSDPNTRPVFSDIAVLYSHPSVQLGWAIDASAHGSTWPRRSSSLDNQCLSSGKNRVAWTRLLEDLGHQARIIDTTELQKGFLQDNGVKVLILPQCFALSPGECDSIIAFTESGGTVIADYGAAITDENGTGYTSRPLDQLFGLSRVGHADWFDGRNRFEINGEKYKQPLIDRLPSDGCLMESGFPVAERDLKTSRHANQFGSGKTLYLNLSPTAYCDPKLRSSAQGQLLRDWIGDTIVRAGVTESVRVTQEDGRRLGVELIKYQTRDGKQILSIVCNPTRQARIDGAGSSLSLNGRQIKLEIHVSEFKQATTVVDLRRGIPLPIQNGKLSLTMKNDEAEILQISQ